MIELRYHGHSFIEIIAQDCRIYIDPFITNNPKCSLSFDDACNNKPNYIIVTHWHEDHVWDTINLCKNTWAQLITTYEIALWAKDQWVQEISEQWIWWVVSYTDYLRVKFTAALHSWWSMIPWSTAAWVLVYLDEHTIFHAGDSWLTVEYKLLWEYETLSCAFLPIWDRYTMWVTDAVRAASMLKSQYIVPIHYNTWPDITADPVAFAREVMLNNYWVPKVLSPWQLLVLE